jgi:hypothetical protein
MAAILAKLAAIKGLKTHLVAAGLLGLGIFQVSTGDYASALTSFMSAAAAFGLNVKAEQIKAAA